MIKKGVYVYFKNKKEKKAIYVKVAKKRWFESFGVAWYRKSHDSPKTRKNNHEQAMASTTIQNLHKEKRTHKKGEYQT